MQRYEQAAPRQATRDRVHEAFSHLVLSDRVLDQLGPAINAGHSMFVYGPPGNGKTVISQAIRNLLDGDIAIPHALEVEGEIIRFYDPVVHEEIPDQDVQDNGFHAGAAVDRRWVRCKRPLVMVGGELTLDSLELTHNPVSGFYRAPVQAIANGGVLVIDDFGRQQCSPRDLLNRWIVPLESRVDFLTLHTGRKFEIPFNVFIVFATNLKPETLADEAFLRRIPYKILAKNPTLDEYCRIFELNCRKRGISFDPVMIEYLQRKYYQPRKLQMRACHPRDLIEQVVDRCRYEKRDIAITRELLDAACHSYFLEESSSQEHES